MTFPRHFRGVREDVLNLTQADLAAELGCSRQRVSRVERGTAEYTHSQLLRLAALSGLPITALFDDSPVRVPGWWREYMRLPPGVRLRADAVLGGVVALARPVSTPVSTPGVPTGV